MLSRCICVRREESLIGRKNDLIFFVAHCFVTICVTYFLCEKEKNSTDKISISNTSRNEILRTHPNRNLRTTGSFPCTSTPFLKYFASPKLRKKWIFIFILKWKTTLGKFLYARRNFLLLLPFPEFRFRPFPSGLRFSWVTCLAVQNSNFGSRRGPFSFVCFSTEERKSCHASLLPFPAATRPTNEYSFPLTSPFPAPMAFYSCTVQIDFPYPADGDDETSTKQLEASNDPV